MTFATKVHLRFGDFPFSSEIVGFSNLEYCCKLNTFSEVRRREKGKKKGEEEERRGKRNERKRRRGGERKKQIFGKGEKEREKEEIKERTKRRRKKCVACTQEDFLFKIHHKAS
jgi:hypothetical protein